MAIDYRASMEPRSPKPGAQWQQITFGKPGVSGTDRMFFIQRLALLLETGSSLHPSLEALKHQTRNTTLSVIIGKMADEVAEGRSFSEAMARHRDAFSSTYVTLISAAERGGYLPKVLNQLLDMEEKQEKMRAMIVSALSYPAFLMFFSGAVVIFILVAVFPKFADMFASIRDHLPATTLVLMFASDMVRKFWPFLIAGTAGTVFLLVRWLKSDAGGMVVDRFKLRTPLLRDIVVQFYLVRFLRVMSMSLSGGVSLLETLAVCREIIGNYLFRKFISKLESQVTEGRGIAAGFENEPFIPSMASQMIRTGEESGNLAMVMARVADFYEKELEKKLKAAEKIVEPLMLVVMGLVVGIIVSSLILPIFKLSKAVG